MPIESLVQHVLVSVGHVHVPTAAEIVVVVDTHTVPIVAVVAVDDRGERKSDLSCVRFGLI